MLKRLICLVLGHGWFYARGYSTGRPMRHCVHCNKQEFTDGRK